MGLVGRMLSMRAIFQGPLSISNGSVSSEGRVVSDERSAVIMQGGLMGK